MRNDMVLNLAECTEFRQQLQARPPAIVKGALILMVLFLATAMVWAAVSKADLIAKASGMVRSIVQETRVQLVHGGKVREVYFREGERVRKGQLLMRLESEPFEVEISKVERAIAAAQADLHNLETLRLLMQREVASQKRQTEVDLAVVVALLRREERLQVERTEKVSAELQLAEEGLETAARERERARTLLRKGIIAAEESEKTERAWRQSQIRKREALALARQDTTAVELARQKVQAAEQTLKVTIEAARTRLQEMKIRIAGRAAELQQLGKDLEKLHYDLAQCALVAPIDGVVIRSEIQPGDVRPAGELVAVIAPEGDLRFDVLVPNSDIAGLYVGQDTRIKLDAYPYQQYGTLAGKISYIAPDATASGSEKSTAPFYKVRIALLQRSFGGNFPVELGMTGTAEMLRGEERLLTLAVQKLQNKVQL